MQSSKSAHSQKPSGNKSSFFKEYHSRLDSLDASPVKASQQKVFDMSFFTKISALVSPPISQTKSPRFKFPIVQQNKSKEKNEVEFYKHMSRKLLKNVKTTSQPKSSALLKPRQKDEAEEEEASKSFDIHLSLNDSNQKNNISFQEHDKPQKKIEPKQLRKGLGDVHQLKIDISRGMNHNYEKKKLEDLKVQSPKFREIEQAFDELKDLRNNKPTLPTHWNVRPNVSHISNPTQPKGLKTSSSSGALLYQMSAEKNFEALPHNRNLTKKSITSRFDNLNTDRIDPLATATARNDYQGEESFLTERHQQQNPFDKMIMYKNKKMPFSLALTAKMRHQIFKEVKKPLGGKLEKDKTERIMELKESIIPVEKARFLEKLDEVEKNKKYSEMQSKKAYTSAIYQMIALNKTSQKRLNSKLKEQFPINSRFLNI